MARKKKLVIKVGKLKTVKAKKETFTIPEGEFNHFDIPEGKFNHIKVEKGNFNHFDTPEGEFNHIEENNN
jgi:hypothetical protein